jgi:mannan endo-1,6-alpha-mannosidase
MYQEISQIRITGTIPVAIYTHFANIGDRWEAGAMVGALIDYTYYTGDTTYNDIVSQAMLHQVGPKEDYMTPNQTKTTGNDDQAFWGIAAMSAAETNFQNPPKDKPQWLALAQAVFNTQAGRWEDRTCGGGLHWQVFPWSPGYNYRNSISNGAFFQLSARLAKYTGNATYAEWAEKTWDWMYSIELISKNYEVFDGSDDKKNCSDVNHIQWTYNAGAALLGAATMYAYTDGADIWRERVEGLLNATDVFFPNGRNIMVEVACEPILRCDIDQLSFKAYLARWMAATTRMAPFTYDTIMARLRSSAIAAAQQCSGDKSGRACGLTWTKGGEWDRSYPDVGLQMAALEVIQSNLVEHVVGPVTSTTGGTSEANPAAGGKSIPACMDATVRDKAGAGGMTAGIIIVLIGALWWMIIDAGVGKRVGDLGSESGIQ